VRKVVSYMDVRARPADVAFGRQTPAPVARQAYADPGAGGEPADIR
jgi:hypothetical protein